MTARKARQISENSELPLTEALKQIKIEAEKGSNILSVKTLNERSIEYLKKLGYGVSRCLNSSKGYTITW